tara:strand:+ start:5369 stop:6538 length:1170 start_codon:yes stop_codon:yes gene_type:complete
MNLTENIKFKSFKKETPKKKILNLFTNLIYENNEILKSLSNSYKDSWSKKTILKLQKFSNILLIGMGGSVMGSKAIYSFLKKNIKKNFFFIDSFDKIKNINLKNKLNLIISKSGNTLETISTSNILIKRNKNNIFITENKNNYLRNLASKLKSEIIEHNNYIGGRYSVLSEVGMLPAELMGLNVKHFRRLNELINSKIFVNSLLINVSNILTNIKNKRYNSVILNYDESSQDLFYWYQQLVAESLGKKGKGIFPIISRMPQDNHSLMQFYLDSKEKNFFTFFFVEDKISHKIKNSNLLESRKYLRNKKLNSILYTQYLATQNVFNKKKIPFRSFFIKKKNEQTLGELFTFFMLEIILLGKALNIDPYNQPLVELVKSETKKNLIKTNLK